MSNSIEIEVAIKAENNVTLHVSDWNGDGGAWLNLHGRNGNMHVVLAVNEARQLLDALQAIVKKGETS